MPIKPQENAALGYVNTYLPKEDVGTFDIISAAFQTENSIGSAISRGRNPDFDYQPYSYMTANPNARIDNLNDSDYEPLDDIQGYEEHASAFIGASREKVGWLKGNIDRQREARADLEASGFGGMAASFAAGVLDPIQWVTFGPGSALLKGGTMAAFTKTAVATGTGAALTELALHATQEERTPEESVFAIGGAGVLGGVLGSAASVLSKREIDPLISQITKEVEDTPSLNPRHAGAAEVQQTSLKEESLVSVAGLEKTVGINPFGRVALSDSVVARRTVQDLAENNYYFEKNLDGRATGQAVETSIKSYNALNGMASENLDKAFLQYRGKTGSGITSRVATQARDLMGSGAREGKLTYGQFKEEISKAMRNGDVHDIPEIQQAAKYYRQNVFEPVKKAAIEQGLLPEDVDVKFADSYLTRVYNFEKMRAQPNQFKKIVTDWFRSTGRELESPADLSRRISEGADVVEETGGRFAAAKQTTQQLNDEIKRLRDLKKASEQEIALVPSGKMDAKRKAGLISEAKEFKTKIAKAQESLSKAVKEREIIKKELSEVKKRLRADKSAYKKSLFINDQGKLDGLAQEVYDNIMNTPGGIVPKNVIPEGSPFKSRTLPIPDKQLAEFLENDIETVAEFYMRSTAPQIEMTKKFGDKDMKGVFEEIAWDYQQKIDKNPQNSKKLMDERDRVLNDLSAMRDQLYGVYNVPADPTSFWMRANKTTRNLQFLSKLGGMVLSSIPDLARPIMVHGLKQNAKMFKALVTSPVKAKMGMQEAKVNAAIFEMIQSTRANAIADIGDMYKQGTKFEKTVEGMSNTFGAVSLMSPWNQMLKQWAGFVSSDAVLRNAVKWSDGTISSSGKKKLAQLGIGENEAALIAEQINKHSDKGDIWLANAGEWDKEIAQIFKNAIIKDTDSMIVTPGVGDIPLWMRSPTGKLVGQFKSFVFASHNRMLIAGLQQRDAAYFNGLMMSMALGTMTYAMKEIVRGEAPSSEPEKILAEAVDYSGVFALMAETNGIVEKATRGNVGINALTGNPPMSRYASRNFTGSILGPTIGTLEDVATVTGGIGMQIGSEPEGFTQRDLRALRRLLPYQNLWYTRNLLNYVEEQTAETIGIPQ